MNVWHIFQKKSLFSHIKISKKKTPFNFPPSVLMIISLLNEKINVEDKRFPLFFSFLQQENPVSPQMMLCVKSFLLLLLVLESLKAEDDLLLASNLRPVRNQTVQEEAALALIKRLLPFAYAKLFSVEVNSDSSQKDWAQINTYSEENTTYVNVKASSGVMATYVFHEYLKQFCQCQISWEHKQLFLPAQLPEAQNFTLQPVDLVRFYQNPCLYGYTFAFWSWSDWSRHIDWMALNGLNLVLASSGQELVWLRTYEKLGLGKLMRNYFTGKAFLPWNRMGNLKAWSGPLSLEAMQIDARLQERILQRLLSLGITPAVPAFNGIVPTEMTHFFPNQTFFPLRQWGNRPFPKQFSGLYYVLPNSSLFQTIQLTFEESYTETYGKVSHFYAFDTFNEMSPHTGDLAFLASYGHSISASLTEMDPKAIWLMQGWMFKNATFWRPSRVKALLQAVEREHILVLDLASTTNPQFSRLEGYYNRPFVYCMLHNYGGVSGLYGKIHEVSTAPYLARAEYSNCVGMGLTPEGLYNSYVMYDLMMESFKRRSSIKDISQWLSDYSRRRYGVKDGHLENAWYFLSQSVFDCCDRLNSSKPFRFHGKTTLTVLPRISFRPLRPLWYDSAVLLKAWDNIFRSSLVNSVVKDYDLVEVTREVLENLLDQHYEDCMKAYYKNDSVAFTNFSGSFMDIIGDLDDLLASDSHFMLGPWLEKAKSASASNYEFMARNLITLWGPEGNILDYARRTWSGLVRDYYGRRWRLFFQMLHDSFSGRKFKQKAYEKEFMKRIGLPFQSSHQLYPTSPTLVTSKVVSRIYKKWILPRL